MNNLKLIFKNMPVSEEYILNTLRENNQIDKLIETLIIDEELKDIEVNNEKADQLLGKFREENNITEEKEYREFLDENYLNESLLVKALTKPSKIMSYREERWGPTVETLYLKHKEEYDLATFHILKAKNADVMQEIYFRLKDGETDWSGLSMLFSNGKDKMMSLQRNKSINIINKQLWDELKKVDKNRITKPFRIGNEVVIAELLELKTSSLDDNIRSDLLRKEFDSWLKQTCNRAKKEIYFQTQGAS